MEFQMEKDNHITKTDKGALLGRNNNTTFISLPTMLLSNVKHDSRCCRIDANVAGNSGSKRRLNVTEIYHLVITMALTYS